MRVLLLAENWPPRVGGIERYLTGLVTHLPPGSTVVVAPRVSDEAGHEPSEELVTRQRFFWPFVRPAWLPLFIRLWRRFRRESYSVLLCGKALFEGQVGYYLKRFLGVPYIVFTYAMEIEAWRMQPRTRRALSRVLGAADTVVYINDITGTTLREAGVPRNKLLKLPPAIDGKWLVPVTEEQRSLLRDTYQLPEQYVLCVARLIERKGVDVLLTAFSGLDQTRFADVQLIIVGDGVQRALLEALSQKLWLANSAQFLGSVPDEDLPGLYGGAKIFALTPRDLDGDYEGFGIVYLEAAAQGVPVIGTTTGGVPEAVLNEHTGLLVPPDDPAATTAALTRLLSDEALRQRLGEAGRTRIRREFSWQSRSKKLHEVISRLSSPAASAP
jgi:phosphatidylinositol alpha-1,6-mannosyltransferase